MQSKSFDLRPPSKIDLSRPTSKIVTNSSRPYETGNSERGIILNNNKTDRVKQS
mgnify:CR=1 FL=1